MNPQVQEYFQKFSPESQALLHDIRNAFFTELPQAVEGVSYGMPFIKTKDHKEALLWYGANKNHIGIYPKPAAILFFKEALKNYKTSKGAIQFPSNQSMPISLIKDILKFRLSMILEKK